MTQVQTKDLTGAALDWAVAKCLPNPENVTHKNGVVRRQPVQYVFAPSTDWSQGGPIIEREKITVQNEDDIWSAYFRERLFEDDGSEHWRTGPTPLVAAMRCFVASKLGDTVEVPEELL